MFRKLQVAMLVSGIALPMMMGQGCPVADPSAKVPGSGGGTGPGTGAGNGTGGGAQHGGVQAAQPTTLLSNNVTSLGAGWIYIGTFNPNSAGKVVTVSVAGNTTGSRPLVIVYDAQFNVVAENLFPTTNTTTVTFTSTSTGDHLIYAFENGTPASLYSITAIEQP